METLANYIVTTLKESGVNTILQQEYLTNVAQGLLKYMMVTNLIGIGFGLLSLVLGIIFFRKRNRDEDKRDNPLIVLVAALFLAAVILFVICGIVIIKIHYTPDLAIVSYLSAR